MRTWLYTVLLIITVGCASAALPPTYEQGFKDAASVFAPVDAMCKAVSGDQTKIHYVCVDKQHNEFDLIRIRQPKGGV